jgi:hypothetical protein
VTTLTATGAVALSPASANVVLSPTGTGVVTINPATAGTVDNVAIGGSTPLAGTFTSLTSSSTFTNSGVGPHAFGSTRADSFIALNNTFSGTSNAYGILGIQNITVPANGNGFGMYMVPTLNKAGSGTHPDFAGIFLDPPTIGAGVAALTNASTLKISSAPSVGTNQRALWVAAGTSLFDGQLIAKGSATNDSAAAGYIGELLTVTVASGSAVSLTTATSANIATLSVTAGDWDCSAQVTHNAAATTSVTLLQIGISVTTATLPTQAGGSGIGTDPLAIFRQAAAVPGGALTTNVGPVRVSLREHHERSSSWRTTPSPYRR